MQQFPIGLIPARAGNTGNIENAAIPDWAHPRSRGEHRHRQAHYQGDRGSSPLARGTPSLFFPARPFFGLIPARAGNTPSYRVNRLSPWAHPRSRGEHEVEVTCTSELAGSSPLARGTHQLQPIHHAPNGLIPARAGNTGALSADQTGNGAHPRSRGEHFAAQIDSNAQEGSSPLARGTRNNTMKKMTVDGLIPARAGNTLESRARGAPVRAHPRSRGEHQG